MKKRMVIILWVVCVLIGSAVIIAHLDYCGYDLAYNYGIDKFIPDAQPDGIRYQRHWIFKNRFGMNAVAAIVRDSTDNTVLVTKGTYTPVRQTHLTMLSLRKGMTVQQMVASIGMPDSTFGSGLVRLRYQLHDGYAYDIVFQYESNSESYDPDGLTVASWNVEDPDGNYLFADEAFAFQRKVRLVYLGVAAVLGVVLVCLLKIPPIIRKRKLKPATE